MASLWKEYDAIPYKARMRQQWEAVAGIGLLTLGLAVTAPTPIPQILVPIDLGLGVASLATLVTDVTITSRRAR